MLHRSAVFFSLAGLCASQQFGGYTNVGRLLQKELIAGYEPLTQVTDYAALDLDQLDYDEQAQVGNFVPARNVYEEGGHSMSFAELVLVNPTPDKSFPAGTKVTGVTEKNKTVSGVLMEDITWGSVDGVNITLKVRYDTSDVQAEYVDCQVGGLFTFSKANRNGCFVGNGLIELTSPNATAATPEAFQYTYDARRANNNDLTIQGLSTRAATFMTLCDAVACNFTEDFQLFLDYYGDADYADKWVLAASNGNITNYSSGKGEADFSILVGTRGGGRSAAMKQATVVLHFWMAVVRQLEYAVYECRTKVSDGGVNSLDIAAAYYVGSLEGQDGSGDGVLVYDLADTLARELKTTKWAGNWFRGTAYVNLEILYHLGEMQSALQAGQCDDAAATKATVKTLMKVPLLQGVLYYAHERTLDATTAGNDVEANRAKGATFLASILPYVNKCDATQADVLYKTLGLGSEPSNATFSTVKGALESVYPCLGVICAQVGGIWNGKDYEPGTEPCDDGQVIVPRFTEAPTTTPTLSPTATPNVTFQVETPTAGQAEQPSPSSPSSSPPEQKAPTDQKAPTGEAPAQIQTSGMHTLQSWAWLVSFIGLIHVF